MIIREATEQDYDSIAALMQQLNSDDVALDKVHGMSIFQTILQREGLTLFVTERQKDLLACCYLNVIPNLSRSGQPYALIENVVTDSQYRRQGIGAKLMRHVIDSAFTQGCYKVMLLSGGGPGAQCFYESCGMEKKSKTGFVIRR